MTIAERPKVKPFTYAPVTIIEGEQGSGKSETAVTRVVDPTFANMTSVKLYDGSKDGRLVRAEPLLNDAGFPVIGYGKLWINGKPRVMKIPPKSCVIADSIRVIYNGHLYGIRYAHMELAEIIEHLNDGLITDCYLIVDEAYIGGDRREGLSPLVRVISKLGKQIRKRHIFFTMCAPDATELDLRFQKTETEHIVCSYDDINRKITMFIRNRKKYKRTREVSYYAPLYWKYYDTDEQFELPDSQITRALQMAN